MEKPYLEFRRAIKDDLTVGIPKTFDTELDGHAKLVLNDTYGMLFLNGDATTKPIYYFRHSNPDSPRFAGILEFGDGYLNTQKSLHHRDLAQPGAKTLAYRQISDEPMCFGFETEEPYSEFRYYEDHATFKEGKDGSILDLTLEFLPYGFADHSFIYGNMSQFSQPGILKGTYEGKPVMGLGSWDHVCLPSVVTKDVGQDLWYFLAGGNGIREDGRFEMYCFNVQSSGKQVGIYSIDGEEPIITDDVELITEWHHLPYMTDGTCIYENAILRIGPKNIHFQGKWGTKGFTETPRIEKSGQSQVFGSFYEGETPYRHKLFSTFHENCNAYDYQIEKLGWKVVD